MDVLLDMQMQADIVIALIQLHDFIHYEVPAHIIGPPLRHGEVLPSEDLQRHGTSTM